MTGETPLDRRGVLRELLATAVTGVISFPATAAADVDVRRFGVVQRILWRCG